MPPVSIDGFSKSANKHQNCPLCKRGLDRSSFADEDSQELVPIHAAQGIPSTQAVFSPRPGQIEGAQIILPPNPLASVQWVGGINRLTKKKQLLSFLEIQGKIIRRLLSPPGPEYKLTISQGIHQRGQAAPQNF